MAATPGAAAGTAAATMTVYFRDENVSTTAAAGDALIEVWVRWRLLHATEPVFLILVIVLIQRSNRI